MFGDFILDFKDQRITGSQPRKIITSFEELQKTDLERGAFGFFSYDFAWEIEKLPHRTVNDLGLPKVLFVVPEKLEVRNRVKGTEASMDARGQKPETE